MCLLCCHVPRCVWNGTLSQTRSSAQVLFLGMAENRSLKNRRKAGVVYMRHPTTLSLPLYSFSILSTCCSRLSWRRSVITVFTSLQFILLTHLFLSLTISCANTSSSIASVLMAPYLHDCFEVTVSLYSLSFLLEKSMSNAFFTAFSMSLAFTDLQKPTWIWKGLLIQNAYPDGTVWAGNWMSKTMTQQLTAGAGHFWQVLVPCSHLVVSIFFFFSSFFSLY